MAGTLEGRNILLGVSGGIAAYKSAEVVRGLRRAGAEVCVVMTDAATRFITPLTLQALSGRPVRRSLWDEAAEAAMGHIELARWADAVVVAPTTAATLARLAQGLADDLLCTLCLATQAPLLIAPAMNRLMWAHPATRANVDLLLARGVSIAGPAEGAQACGEEGAGRMVEPEQVLEALSSLLAQSGAAVGDPACGTASGLPSSQCLPLAGRRVLVTAGPTRERLDPVRFLSNRSSGRMGYAVAAACAQAGARVTLVSGPVGIAAPPGVDRVSVESAREMHEAVMRRVSDADLFIGTAAVADYECQAPAAHKLKKAQLGDRMVLELTPAPDILKSVAALPDGPFTVGFAAETRDLEHHARDKLDRKRLDMIAANLVGDGQAFDCEDNTITVFWPGGGRAELGHGAKDDLARRLVALIAEHLQAALPEPVAP